MAKTYSMNLADYFTKIHKIEEFLYLGDIKCASDAAILKELNIKTVITVMDSDIPDNIKVKGISYIQINITDDPNEIFLVYLPEINKIIGNGQTAGQNVLVHCYSGVSRSATVVIAFLMNKYKKPYKEAFKLVEEIRKKISPNDGFIKQLVLYEQIGYKIDANNRKLRQHFIQTLLFNTNVQNSIDRYFQKMSQLERISEKTIDLGRTYLCSKCKFELCNEINVIKNWEKSTDRTCPSVYIEPMNWMRSKIFDSFGTEKQSGEPKTIGCPNCKEMVVVFNKDFQIFQCPCDQHRNIKCLYFCLRVDKFKIK